MMENGQRIRMWFGTRKYFTPSTPTLLQLAIKLHSQAPGTWIETDRNITKILSTRNATETQPLNGGLWWRTHHLVRQLGGQA
jgi:hypothetical protein